MNIQPLHENFKVPVYSSENAGAFDIFMPESGTVFPNNPTGILTGLGFAAEVPPGFVALLIPRSGIGIKHGLSLNNTLGVIDSDYRGEWKVALHTKDLEVLTYQAGDRLIQVLILEAWRVDFTVVDKLSPSKRDSGGFGSTGS